jgi:predicted DNA-binding protein
MKAEKAIIYTVKEKPSVYSVRLPNAMRKDLQKISDREKVPVSTVIRKAIELLLIQDQKERPNP